LHHILDLGVFIGLLYLILLLSWLIVLDFLLFSFILFWYSPRPRAGRGYCNVNYNPYQVCTLPVRNRNQFSRLCNGW